MMPVPGMPDLSQLDDMPDDMCMISLTHISGKQIMTSCWIIPQDYVAAHDGLVRAFGPPMADAVIPITEEFDRAAEMGMADAQIVYPE